MIRVLHTTRKGLLVHIINFLTFCRVKFELIDATGMSVEQTCERLKGSSHIIVSNGNDEKDLNIIKMLSESDDDVKFIFSEYAWFTWSRNIYLDESGIGNKSFLFEKTPEYFNDFDQEVFDHYMTSTLNELNKGNDVKHNKFVVVPLQVDGDSKLNIGSPNFSTVESFLKYILNDYLEGYEGEILIKKHPDDKRSINEILPFLNSNKDDRLVDITSSDFSKKQLIEKSEAILGINSTFLMETLLLNRRPIAFGMDVFSNKGLTFDGMASGLSNSLNNVQDSSKFIYALMSRQVNKKEYFDKNIMAKSFWYNYFRIAS
jgi:hypothetical protein